MALTQSTVVEHPMALIVSRQDPRRFCGPERGRAIVWCRCRPIRALLAILHRIITILWTSLAHENIVITLVIKLCEIMTSAVK